MAGPRRGLCKNGCLSLHLATQAHHSFLKILYENVSKLLRKSWWYCRSQPLTLHPQRSKVFFLSSYYENGFFLDISNKIYRENTRKMAQFKSQNPFFFFFFLFIFKKILHLRHPMNQAIYLIGTTCQVDWTVAQKDLPNRRYTIGSEQFGSSRNSMKAKHSFNEPDFNYQLHQIVPNMHI